jgi:hypothetical protein
MKRVSASKLLKLASYFESLAQASIVNSPRPVKYLYSVLASILGTKISEEDFFSWYQNNITVLAKFAAPPYANQNWYENFLHEAQLDLPQLSSKPNVVHYILIVQDKLNSRWTEDTKYIKREILEESLLKGFGKIPNLKLFVLESISLTSGGQLPKEVAHEEFIFTALNEIFGPPSDDEIVQFCIDNKNKIDKIRNLFKGKPSQLGGGMPTSDGVAFSLGPKLVLKIFRDTFSYNKAVEATERLHKHPELAKTEAMIYDIGVLGEFKGQQVYYYIMERMKTVRDLDDDTRDSLQTIAKEIALSVTYLRSSGDLKDMKKNISDPTKHSDIKTKVRAIAKDIAEKLDISNAGDIDTVERGRFKMQLAYNDPRRAMGPALKGDNLKLNPNWLALLAEEILMKYLTSRTDIHMGNLGVTRYGEFRYFDPAYSGWTSGLNL